MNEPPKQCWGCMQWGVVMVVTVLLGALSVSLFTRTSEIGGQSKGVSNCKQVILSLKLFAKDNGYSYPDSGPGATGVESANQFFHRLFEEGIVTEEHIFGCPNSVFVPDGKLGAAPDFARALATGECHWMLLKSQTAASIGSVPVVVENALNSSWPPKWDVSDHGGSKRGRAWKGAKIIIGRNDSSVSVEQVREDGTMDWRSPSNLGPDGKSWIDTLSPEQIAKLSYWDVEEK